jgi:hypothetical protein
MKRTTLLKTMFLLCALVAGSSSVWAVTKPWSGDDPSTTLNLQTITSSTMGTWNGTTSWYLDDDYLIVSGYESYKSVSNQTWITQASVGSNQDTWDASAPFKGSSYYTNKYYATIQAGRYLLYKVTNLKSLKVYGKNNSTSKYLDIFIYTKTGNDYTQVEEIKYTADNNVHIWSSTETLSASETYYIYIKGVGSSNSRVFEVAFERNSSSDPSSAVAFDDTTPSISFPNQTTYSQTATTATGYTGTVIYTITDNTAGATIEGSTVTVKQEGSVTVKATAPAVSGWAKSEATYTLTVTDTRSDNGLSYATATQSVAVGSTLSAPTLTNPNGLAVTFASDDTGIATVDASGNVTGVAIGSTTITATFAGDETYKAGSASYTINVTRGKELGELLYESVSTYTNTNDGTTALTASNTYLDSDRWSSFSYVYPGKKISGDSDGHLKFGNKDNAGTAVTKSLALNGNATLTYKVQRYDSSNTGNLKITVSGATASGDVDVTGTANWVEKTVTITGGKGNVIITFATTSSNNRIRVDDILLIQTTAVATISDAKYATFHNGCPTDFSNTGITAYTATDNETSVKLNEIANGQVPANTPVVLYKEGADGTAINVPVIASANAVGDNDLHVSDGTTATADQDIYVLSKKNNVVGFYKWGGDVSLSAGKIYLKKITTGSPEFLGFGDATAIEKIANSEEPAANGQYYNLNGQRVAQPTKGLYIVNGKKIIVK